MIITPTLQTGTWKLTVTRSRCHSMSVTWLGSGSKNLTLEPCFCPQHYGVKDMNTNICFQSCTNLPCHQQYVSLPPHSHSTTWLMNIFELCQWDLGERAPCCSVNLCVADSLVSYPPLLRLLTSVEVTASQMETQTQHLTGVDVLLTTDPGTEGRA